MKSIIAATAMAAAAILSNPAGLHAETAMSATMPDTSALSEDQARALITRLAQVNVITSNCPAHAISDGEWTLITGTSDQLAAQLGLDASEYDRQFYAPAFRLLDDPGACDRVGATTAGVLDELRAMGGDTAPVTRSE